MFFYHYYVSCETSELSLLESGRMKVFVRIKPHENDGKESLCVEAQKDQLQVSVYLCL